MSKSRHTAEFDETAVAVERLTEAVVSSASDVADAAAVLVNVGDLRRLLRATENAPKPSRPYREGTPLIVVSESEWGEAQEAFSQVIELQDAVANANAYVERLPEKVADYLLTHVGGDESQQWQAGHNYAMREAARLVREKWYALDEGDPTPEDGYIDIPPEQETGESE